MPHNENKNFFDDNKDSKNLDQALVTKIFNICSLLADGTIQYWPQICVDPKSPYSLLEFLNYYEF